jgi:hypothetical protein
MYSWERRARWWLLQGRARTHSTLQISLQAALSCTSKHAQQKKFILNLAFLLRSPVNTQVRPYLPAASPRHSSFNNFFRSLNYRISRQNVTYCCSQRGVGLRRLQEGINAGKIIGIRYILTESIRRLSPKLTLGRICRYC